MPTLIDQAPDQEELEQEPEFSEEDAGDTAANINKNLGFDDFEDAKKDSGDDSGFENEGEPEHRSDDGDFGGPEQNQSGGDEQKDDSKKDDSGGGNQLDQVKDLKDKVDKAKDLKDKLSGAKKGLEAGKNIATAAEGAVPAGGTVAGGGAATTTAAAAGSGAAAGGTAVAAGGGTAAVATAPAWGPFVIPVAVGVILVIFIVGIIASVIHMKQTETAEAAPPQNNSGGGGPGSGSGAPGSPRGCPMTGTITTPYGKNIITYPYYPNHDGVDIGNGVKDNHPVYNTLDGNAVSSTGRNNNQIVTVTGGNYTVVFYHLQVGSRVADGPVKVGDVIGNEDETGNVDGEHIHYEVLLNGIWQNPIDYMPATIYYTQPADNDFTGVPFPSQGKWGECNTLPQDTTPGSGGSGPGGGSGAGLDYYIPYGDSTILPDNPQRIIDFANARYPTNHINDGTCPGLANGCWDFVIQQSLANGISPAFTISIWQEEGGFGGAGARTEFGCYPGGIDAQVDFRSSLACFLDFSSREHPYNPANPYQSFYDWVNNFCGPDRVTICGVSNKDPNDNNFNFIPGIRSTYESISGRTVIPKP